MAETDSLGIDPNIIDWIYEHRENENAIPILERIHKIITNNQDFIDPGFYPVYELISNPDFIDNDIFTSKNKNALKDVISKRVIDKSQYNSRLNRLEKIGKGGSKKWNDYKNINKYVEDWEDDLFINLSKKDNKNEIKYPSYLNKDGLELLINEYPSLKENKQIEDFFDKVGQKEEHEKQIKDEINADAKKREIENLSKMKNKKNKEIEEMQEEFKKTTEANSKELESLRNSLFQVNQKMFIRKKLQNDADRIPKEEFLRKLENDIDNNEKEVIDSGINKKNYKKITDEIYNQAPFYKVKHEKTFRKLMGVESSKLPEGIQASINKIIGRDFENDYKRRKYILPKKKVNWKPHTQSNKINPMILKGIPK